MGGARRGGKNAETASERILNSSPPAEDPAPLGAVLPFPRRQTRRWEGRFSPGMKPPVFPLSLPEKIRKCKKVHENLSLKFSKLKTTQSLKRWVWFESWTKVCSAAPGASPTWGLEQLCFGAGDGEIVQLELGSHFHKTKKQKH